MSRHATRALVAAALGVGLVAAPSYARRGSAAK
jgi:hypothetical protein